MKKIILPIISIFLFTTLISSAFAAVTISSDQKISDTAGSFAATLDNGDQLGRGLTNIGDLDLDGVEDMAFGAPNDDDAGTDAGAIYILFMDTDGTVQSYQKITEGVGGFAETLDNTDWFGERISNVGDLDNDGVQDLVVGARGDDDGGASHGAVYILFMDTDGTVQSSQKISDTAGGFTAAFNVSDWFGGSVEGIGDLDGDTVEDIVVGAYEDDDGGSGRGAVYVIFLNTNGTVKSFQKISDTAGGFTATLDNIDYFGSGIADLGDLDGVGGTPHAIAVGAYVDDDGGDGRGAVYVLFLNSNGTVSSYQKISDTAGGFTATLANNDRIGIDVDDVGDIDGDGIVDIVIGAYGDDIACASCGSAYLVFLDTDGTVADTDGYIRITEGYNNFSGDLDLADRLGYGVSGVGDLDNDGIPELAIGAYSDDDGGSDRGAGYIVFFESGYTLSGRLYSDTGTTAVTSNANATVSVAINGVLAGTDATGTDGSGDWSVNGISYSPGDIITVYLDGAAIPDNAVTVTVGPAAAADISDLDLYYDSLIVRHENAGPITNANLDTAHTADADVTAIYADGGVNDLDLAESLYIKAGETYTPGGNINIAGDWNNQGTFTASTFSTVFDGTAQSIFGTTTFNNFTKTSTAAESLTFQNGLTTEVGGTLTLDGDTGQVITIDSNSAGSSAAINVTGTLGTLDYIDVKDNTLQESGVTKDPALNSVDTNFATSSTNSGNAAGWYKADLTYASSLFQEDPADDGSINNAITITLVGDMFNAAVLDGSTFTETTHYSVANKPAGLTAELTKTTSTTASFTLTGNAASHETGDYINDFTINFLDAAFSASTAAEVTNATKNDFEMNFFTSATPPAGGGSGSAPFVSVLIGNTQSDDDTEEEPDEEEVVEEEPVEEDPDEEEIIEEEPVEEDLEPELPVSPILDAAEEIFFAPEPVVEEEVLDEEPVDEPSDSEEVFSDEELDKAIEQYKEGDAEGAGNEAPEKLEVLMEDGTKFQEEVENFQDKSSDSASEVFDSGETIQITKTDGTKLKLENLEDYKKALAEELETTHPSLIDLNDNKVSDLQEYIHGVNLFKDDEDGDGIPSWKEIMCNSTDPLTSDELDLAIAYEDGITIGRESGFLLCSSKDSEVNIGMLSKEEYENGNYKELLELGSGEFEDQMTFIDPDKVVENGEYYFIMQGEEEMRVMNITVSDTETLRTPTITQETGEIGPTVKVILVLYGAADPTFDIEGRIAEAEKIYISADVGVLQFVFNSRVVYSTVFSDANQIEVKIPRSLALGEDHLFTAYLLNQSAVSDVATVVFAR